MSANVRIGIGKPELIEVPTLSFLRIDGEGRPDESPDFEEAGEALFAIGKFLKLLRKKRAPELRPIRLGSLEELCWVDENVEYFLQALKSKWRWAAMVALTGEPSRVELKTAIAGGKTRARSLGLGANPYIGRIRLASWREGLCAQVMHRGPYDAEEESIALLLRFIEESGYAVAGKRHEIYISNPALSAEERLRTVIRFPIREKT